MDLVNKKIVLTGAASGIGLALLNMLARQQVQILAVDVNEEALKTVCNNLLQLTKDSNTIPDAKVTPYVCDLSAPENVEKLFDIAKALLGGIDLFIANAGFASYEQIEKEDWAHIEKIYRVNVFRYLYIIEKMQALYGEKPYKVADTASAMAHIAVPGYAIYSSTKAALDGFADGYRWQMKDQRRLMLVYPITTRTNFFQTAGTAVPTPWPSQTSDVVAKAILAGIRKDRQRVYPSFMFQLILFLMRFLPTHWLVQYLEQKPMNNWLLLKDR